MIELPRDAEGREVPLDTKILYNEDGKCFKVNRFTYSVVQTMPGLKWGVVFMDCRYDYCSSFYLTPPETPDSWEKLEEDFDRCIEESDSCRYFGPGGDCFKCARPDSDTCGCTAYGKPITGINAYILSCGHQAVGFEKPRYCPECGEEVGE